MPTPERTTLEEIVAAARDLLDDGGPANVTMQAVAQRVGVRAPSLYKRVRDREALLTLVSTQIAFDLGARLAEAGDELESLARAYRRFAHEQPEGFRLILGGPGDPEVLARVSAPVLRATGAAIGDECALDAARLLTAWVTGFAMMELLGAFRLGGSVDDAFEWGLGRIVSSLDLQEAGAPGHVLPAHGS